MTRAFAAVAAGLLVALSFVASPAANADATASLGGHVTNAVTGHPLIGAVVTNVDLGTSTTTDADGAFVVAGLPAGQYRLSIALTGYWTGLTPWYTIADGEELTGADLALEPENQAYLSSPPPVIIGIPRVGVPLEAQIADWSPQQDAFSLQWFANGEAVPGATAATFVPTADLLGKSLYVRATGTRIREDEYYVWSQSADVTSPVRSAAVIGRSASVTGDRSVGQTLVAVPGTWSPASTVLSYQWFRDSAVIAGATAQSYVLRVEDVGAVVNVVITGRAGGLPAVSRPGRQFFATGPGLFTAPAEIVVAGIPTVGTPLVLNWSGPFSPAPTSLAYRWSVGGVQVSTSTGYTPIAADLGKQVSVTVTALRAGFDPVAVEVVAGAAVAPGAIVSTSAPALGAARVGKALTVTGGSWAPASAALAYQWYRNGAPIAVGSVYTPVVGDLDAALTVSVTASLAGYTGASRSSNASTVTEGAFATAPKPTIGGSFGVGGTASVSVGAWSPSGASFSYQWKVGGLTVGGATGSTYRVRPTDADRRVTVAVTATKPGFATTTVESAASPTVVGRAYSLCSYLLADYPYGVMQSSGTKDKVKSGGVYHYLEPYGPPFVSASVYALNASGRDADDDGIACEQRP